jgi:hypothetical protein
VESSKAWRNKNQKYSLEYYYNNKKAWIDRNARYIRNKYKTDKNYRIEKVLSSQIWSFLNGKTKSNRTMKLIGYTAQEFVNRLGLGLDNQQIDHKIPITWFKKLTPLDIVWNLDNLQWMDAKENQTKGNRFAHPISERYLQLILPHIETIYIHDIRRTE